MTFLAVLAFVLAAFGYIPWWPFWSLFAAAFAWLIFCVWKGTRDAERPDPDRYVR